MTTADKCVHCHKCRDSCDFLAKYGIDIGDTDRLKELAFHCFLCGKCTAVCPLGIDGRETVLGFRREKAASEEDLPSIEKSYKGLIKEKRDYKFSNWKRVKPAAGAGSGTAFFPGCNFPSMYPKTNAKLSEIFAEHGIGTVYECCGKPIAELGMTEDEERIIEKIKARLPENGISEIVTACPNCRDFFGDKLGVEVKSVYTKLSELGIGNTVDGDAEFFVPCPDRTTRIWIEELRPFIKGDVSCTDAAQCCGLGGSAAMLEPDLADGFVEKLRGYASGSSEADRERSGIYTYCASCMGRFRRKGLRNIDHILPHILGTGEQPDTGKSYINRVLTKIK